MQLTELPTLVTPDQLLAWKEWPIGRSATYEALRRGEIPERENRASNPYSPRRTRGHVAAKGRHRWMSTSQFRRFSIDLIGSGGRGVAGPHGAQPTTTSTHR